MSTITKIIIFALTILFVITCVGGCGYYFSVNKTEAQMRLQVEAQQDVCKSHFDKMWKILQDQAGVTESYKNSFKDIYVGIMDGRYNDNPNLLMKWVQESNPQFDIRLFDRLMESIQVERTSFHTAQTKLIDMNREHKFYVSPNNRPTVWFLSNTQPVNVTIVTSARTENAYQTGQDNETLFKR